MVIVLQNNIVGEKATILGIMLCAAPEQLLTLGCGSVIDSYFRLVRVHPSASENR